MSRRRSSRSKTRPVRGSNRTVLRGVARDHEHTVTVEARDKSQRDRLFGSRAQMAAAKAVAADPHSHVMAQFLEDLNAHADHVGGRPEVHAGIWKWIYGALIPIYGSASAVERELSDPDVWLPIARAALPYLPPDVQIPKTAPRRWEWEYFLNRKIVPHLPAILDKFEELAAKRALDVGLLDPDTWNLAHPDRRNIVGMDGKVEDSPQASDTSKRKDPARFLTIKGDGRWSKGTHFAIASTRANLPGLRVALAIEHVPHSGDGGEAGAFERIMRRLIARNPDGIVGFVADGAMEGTHIAEVLRTGHLMISPTFRLDKKHGGVVIDGYGRDLKPLPLSQKRQQQFARVPGCGAHAIYAGDGTLFERIVTVDGKETYRPIERGQVKRQHNKTADTYSWYVEYRLPCRHTNGEQTHTWWEPVTPTAFDKDTGFNRSRYLRPVNRTHPEYARLYGMRADTESFNAELAHCFHKKRLPAWGLERQTVVMMLALMRQNSWALHVWRRERDQQTRPPPEQAA